MSVSLAPALWTGTYINLERSADRRTAMQDRLAKVGLSSSYERFSALTSDDRPRSSVKPGELGCFRSHHAVISSARRDGRFLHILEDDALISPQFASAANALIAGRQFDPYDLIFTDIFVPDDLATIRLLKRAWDRAVKSDGSLSVTLFDLGPLRFAATASYFVNPKSFDLVADTLSRQLAAGPTTPIDLYFRQEVNGGRLKAACIFPFLTSVDIDHTSTISITDPSRVVLTLLRSSFYVGRDLRRVSRIMKKVSEASPHKGVDTHLDLLTDIARYALSGSYRQF